MKNGKWDYIDEKHPLYMSTRIEYLLNKKIQEAEIEATIFVENTFVRNLLLEKRQLMVDTLKKPVHIVVDETIKAPAEEGLKLAAVKAQSKGSATGIQPFSDYIAIPYFVSKSNENAFKASQLFLKKKAKGIMFLHGETGTGKTHLLHLMAKEAIDLGGRVYLNSSHAFIEELKDHFTKKDIGFIAQYADNHFFMLDDFQIFNKEFSKGYYDTLFEVINSLMLKGRNIIFCSDIDMADFTLFPDRIISRLHTSYVADIKLPDIEIKKQFLDFYARKIEIEEIITEDAKQIVLHSTKTLRDVVGALHMCLMLNKDGELPVRELFNKLKGVGGRKGGTFHRVYAMLAEYYGVSEKETTKNKKGYRPRSLGKLNSVLYYLFHDKMDIRTLRQKLNILARKHSYTLDYGQKNFTEIKDREIRDQVETIIQEREDRTVSLFHED